MKIRIISAILMICILVPILLIGGIPFGVLMLLMGFLGLRELIHLKNKESKIPFVIEILAYLLCSYLILNHFTEEQLLLNLDYRIIALVVFVCLIPILIINNNKKYSYLDGFYLIGSIFLIGFSFNLILLLRNYSLNIVIYLLLITIFSDTFAYVTGKLIGKNKLCPKISPNKTIEGSIGGVVMGSFIAIMFYITVINPDISLVKIIFMTGVLSIISQIGDLVFSQIKRYFKVKDFSDLIPGHGGILDRFDSIIFVVLAYVFFI